MSLMSALLSLTLMLMPASPMLALASSTATTTATTTLSTSTGTQSGGSSVLYAALGFGAALAGVGIVSSILFKSFGGRIIAAVPCISALGPSLWVTIVPAGLLPGPFIWTPATITFSAGPPRTPGQQVLGLSDIPYVCHTPTVPPIPLPGLRMFSVGTSLY